jgi:hypothetical protein
LVVFGDGEGLSRGDGLVGVGDEVALDVNQVVDDVIGQHSLEAGCDVGIHRAAAGEHVNETLAGVIKQWEQLWQQAELAAGVVEGRFNEWFHVSTIAQIFQLSRLLFIATC